MDFESLKSIIDPPTNNNNKELNIIFFLSNICLKENNPIVYIK